MLIEITRSFTYKLNVGNYESRDFFCSQKAECKPEDAERVSEALYQFCKGEVIKSVNQFKKERDIVPPPPISSKDPEEEYFETPPQIPLEGNIDLGDGKGVFPKHQSFEHTPFPIPEVTYEATDKKGGKKKINKEENTTKPL